MHSINRNNTSINGSTTDNTATFSVNSETCDDPKFDDNFDDNKDFDDNQCTEFNSLLDSSVPDEQSSEDNLQNNDTHGTCQFMTSLTKMQIRLNEVINNHKASLKIHDDIIDIFNDYISAPDFDRYRRLSNRKSFMQRMESTFKLTHLRPRYCDVQLHYKSVATVPIFDAKDMILDLLTNPMCMQKNNLADGYDIFTGLVNEQLPANQRYDEVHTGDAWMPARNRFCQQMDKTNVMPVGLILFGDKSHTDLHGALLVTPIIFTLTMFNRNFRNNSNSWRPLAYIPNLSYGKNKADKTKTAYKVQDEHSCISVALKSIKDIHRNGGFPAVVMGKQVHVTVWIHYFIGDTEGNNKWLGHYPGNRKKICRPYRDCKCNYFELSNPNPTCDYTTLEEMHAAKRLKLNNHKEGALAFKNMSRYNIENALLHKDLPLSDNIHGPYRMMPPELLHTSVSGLIIYMFESLRVQIGCGNDWDNIDKQHIRMAHMLKRQSERDFPRGATRNGLVDGTKC
jgi:hypothetical protein